LNDPARVASRPVRSSTVAGSALPECRTDDHSLQVGWGARADEGPYPVLGTGGGPGSPVNRDPQHGTCGVPLPWSVCAKAVDERASEARCDDGRDLAYACDRPRDVASRCTWVHQR